MRFEFIGREEHIVFSNYNKEYFSIDLIRGSNANTFIVTSSLDDTWSHEFKTVDSADYERVKFNIMEILFECEEPDEVLDALVERFEDGFADILVQE